MIKFAEKKWRKYFETEGVIFTIVFHRYSCAQHTIAYLSSNIPTVYAEYLHTKLTIEDLFT
jgi:hypothetical protein